MACVASFTLAGTGRRAIIDGSRSEAHFDRPNTSIVLPTGLILLVDGDVLRVLDVQHETVAPLVTSSPFCRPLALLLIDAGGGVLVADSHHHRIRLLQLVYETLAGQTQVRVVKDLTLAGTGKPGNVDGPAAKAQLCYPTGLCALSDGSVLFSDHNHALRRIHGRPGKEGLFVTTVVGGPGSGFVDGGPGTARLSLPGALAALEDGTVLVCDSGNRAIRALHPPSDDALLSGLPAQDLPLGSWALTTLCKAGVLREPASIASCPDGAVLVSDAGCNTIMSLGPAASRANAPTSTSGPGLRHVQIGDLTVASLLLSVDARIDSGAGSAPLRQHLHTSLALQPEAVEAYCSAPPSQASHIVAALRNLMSQGRATPGSHHQEPPPFHASVDDGTAALQALQAALRAHIVPYHDVGALQATHQRYARLVRAAGSPPPPSAVDNASMRATLPRGHAHAHHHHDRGASLSPFVLARSRSAAAMARSVAQLNAEGLARSEARFRRPAGLCALDSIPGLAGCIAVCDAGNAMVRLLVREVALHGREGPSTLLKRLAPSHLLERAVAAALSGEVEVVREIDYDSEATSDIRRNVVSEAGPSRGGSLESQRKTRSILNGRRPAPLAGKPTAGRPLAARLAPSRPEPASPSVSTSAASALLHAADAAASSLGCEPAGHVVAVSAADISQLSAIPHALHIKSENGAVAYSAPPSRRASISSGVGVSVADCGFSSLDDLASLSLEELVVLQDDSPAHQQQRGPAHQSLVEQEATRTIEERLMSLAQEPHAPAPAPSLLFSSATTLVSIRSSPTRQWAHTPSIVEIAPSAAPYAPAPPRVRAAPAPSHDGNSAARAALDATRLASLLRDLRGDLTPQLEDELWGALLGGDHDAHEAALPGSPLRAAASAPLGVIDPTAQQPGSASKEPLRERMSRWQRRGAPTQPKLASSLGHRARVPAAAAPSPRAPIPAQPPQHRVYEASWGPLNATNQSLGAKSLPQRLIPSNLSFNSDAAPFAPPPCGIGGGAAASVAAGRPPVPLLPAGRLWSTSAGRVSSAGSVTSSCSSAAGRGRSSASDSRFGRAGALSSSFLAEQLCPSRNGTGMPPGWEAPGTGAHSRDALAAEAAGPATQMVRQLLAQVQQQQRYRDPDAGGRLVTTAGPALLKSRFTQHTAASAGRVKAGGRLAVRDAPAFVNVGALLGQSVGRAGPPLGRGTH